MLQRPSHPLQAWIRPGMGLLLMSIGLHVGLLSLPLPEEPSDPEPEVPTQAQGPPDTIEPETIEVVSLPRRQPVSAPSPQPAPTPAPVPAQTTPKPPPPTAPIAQPTAVPSPEPAPQASPAATPEPEPEPVPTLEPQPPEPTPSPQPTSLSPLEDPEAYVYNQKSGGDYNGADALTRWLEQQRPFPQKLTDPVVEVTYPLDQCLVPEPVAGSLGVIVQPGGAIELRETLGSTGYDVLDNQALEELDALSLPAVDQRMAFSLPVQVQYDPSNCTP